MTTRRNFIQMLGGSVAGLAAQGAGSLGGLTGIAGVGALTASGAASAAAPLTIAFPTDVPSWDPLVRVA
ncbi:hypothetical protein, partial [Paraburkholderia sp. SIMBA_030]